MRTAILEREHPLGQYCHQCTSATLLAFVSDNIMERAPRVENHMSLYLSLDLLCLLLCRSKSKWSKRQTLTSCKQNHLIRYAFFSFQKKSLTRIPLPNTFPLFSTCINSTLVSVREDSRLLQQDLFWHNNRLDQARGGKVVFLCREPFHNVVEYLDSELLSGKNMHFSDDVYSDDSSIAPLEQMFLGCDTGPTLKNVLKKCLH